MRRTPFLAVAVLAVAVCGVGVSSAAPTTDRPPAAALPPVPAAEQGPPLIRQAGPAGVYRPRTRAGLLAVGDAHEQRWRLAGPGQGGAYGSPARIGSTGSDAADGLLIDPATAAPASAVWFWRAPLSIWPGFRGCVRVYNASRQEVVAGSEQCLSIPADWPRTEQTWIYDSLPFPLPAGQNVLVMQGWQTDGPRPVGMPILRSGAELVVRWVES